MVVYFFKSYHIYILLFSNNKRGLRHLLLNNCYYNTEYILVFI